MTRTKKRYFVGMLMIVTTMLFLLGGCRKTTQDTQTKNESATASTTKTSTTKSETKKNEKSVIPTLFFHGYSGTAGSFGGMIGRFEQADAAKKELVLTVASDGTIQAEGELSGEADNPIVQVLFADNVNNEWNQTEWIKNCLSYLQENYQIDTVNMVGHSMGGVSALRYLMTYGQEADLPKVDKFVAIGAPFNDFTENDPNQTLADERENGPNSTSSRYQDYQQLIGNLPTDVSFLLLAGQLAADDPSDGTVSLTSSLAVEALLKQNGNQVQEQIIEGSNAHHSQLHENTEVDKYVKDFLWNE